ncbi:MAG: hypothetical protein ACRDNH_05700 [Gaiellaceae bacterium]
MRKLQLALAAGLASALTALAMVVAMAEAEPTVVPNNTEAPGVVGTAQDGELLAAKDGEWSGTDPMTFTYQWQACDGSGANCANITGATGKVYRVATSDVGKRLRVQVTARNSSGTDTAAAPASSPVVHPTGATRIADGRYSIPATSVKEPFRLVISGVEFVPSVLRSRQEFTGRFRVTDTRGYVVRDAIVLVTGVPLGWINAPQEIKTNVDGLATIQLQPTTRLRLVRGGSMVMFIRARKEGDNILAGISSRRLVRVRTVRPSP